MEADKPFLFLGHEKVQSSDGWVGDVEVCVFTEVGEPLRSEGYDPIVDNRFFMVGQQVGDHKICQLGVLDCWQSFTYRINDHPLPMSLWKPM